ncbi:MAG: LysR family transcriptional regulator, partial [Clostridiales bacterium]|nr:LysR family transcriptional regulator [Clostridiales bacterium]
MIEIKQLLYFRTCVEEGSISTAAEKLYTTQPNVSRVISSLETQMGTTLLHRNARGVVRTSEG